MADLLGIGVSGLSASQSAISTTGNNISNANTAGYSRQRVELTPQPAQYNGAGYIGSGVKVASVQRVVDQFYIGQLRSDTATFNELDSYTTQISQLDSLLADQSTGLSPSLQQFFSDVQQASQDPTSVPVRQVVLSDAGSLAQRFSTLNERLQSLSQSVNQQFSAQTSQATTLAQSIAKINQDIVNQSGGTGAQPNSLLDQREELVRQLSEIVGVNVVPQSDGMVNVFMGNGQPLVIGNRASTMGTRTSTTDPSQQVITLQSGGNGAAVDVTQYTTGGTLGGLVKFQNGTLNNAFNSLGQIAITFSDAVNTQHKLGVDLNGNAGTNLFTDINSPASMTSRALRASTNTGTEQPSVFISNASALTTSDYKLSFTSATAYTLTRISDSTVVNSGTLTAGQTTIPASGATDGFQVQISATPSFAAGDTFAIQPTRLGAQNIAVSLQDPKQLALAQPVRTDANLANTGGGAISQGVMVPQYQAATAGTTLAVANPLTTPLLVRFTSATTYQVLNNTNPAAPAAFVPALTGTFTTGQNNVVQINNASGVPSYQFTLSGNPATGDQFSIAANTSGTSDNRNALALANLNLSKAVGGLTMSDAYGKMVSDIGATTASLKNNRDAANTLLTQAQSNRDSVSAVNLDEEAANLIKFQQAYSASAQVISIARTLFTTLLGAFQ
ncbi:MAG: flagellar hook-associated protein FlgK [Verrucomicrobiaceae bacterium]|nr:flagellar hook-associated protein FlgK [Verrucomicrobiaceae bacterium]